MPASAPHSPDRSRPGTQRDDQPDRKLQRQSLPELFDRLVIDKLVDAVALFPNLAGAVLRPIQNGVVQNYAYVMLLGLAACLVWMLQSLAVAN